MSRGNNFPFMLNSTEYKIDTADNCKVPTIVSILTCIRRINALLGEKARNIFIIQHVSFLNCMLS